MKKFLLGIIGGVAWLGIMKLSYRLMGGKWEPVPVILSIITFIFVALTVIGMAPQGEWRRTGRGTPYFEGRSISPPWAIGGALTIVVLGIIYLFLK